MRIIGLKVSNYKRVQAIELRPDGRSVMVGGKNAQGKSSLLDAIADALGGAKRGSKTELPLRTGSVKGEVRVDLGDYVVTRTWSPSSDKLVVESPPGSPIKSPQAVLDRLVGDLSFDPLGFAREPAVKQAETMRRLSGLDTRAIEARRAAAYAERTGVNAALKKATAVRDELTIPPEPPPVPERPSVANLLAAQREHRTAIAASARVEAAPAALESKIGSLGSDIGRLEQTAETANGRIASTASMRSSYEEALGPLRAAASAALPELEPQASALVRQAEAQVRAVEQRREATVAERDAAREMLAERAQDKARLETELVGAREQAAIATSAREAVEAKLADVERALADADAATARAEAAQRMKDAYTSAQADWKRRDAEVQRLDAEARRLTQAIEAVDEEKLRAIGAARFPVEGLGIEGDMVTFRGVPFSQASQAEKVRVGIAIAEALNPTLRVVLIREGALLDDESLAAVLAAAAERGFQVWVETVGDRGVAEGVGIVIEDGRLVAQSEPAAPADAETIASMTAQAAGEEG